MEDEQLNATFMALADPTRRALLRHLMQGDASVVELAAPFALTPRAISKHIAVLEQAGLVTRGRDAQRRPSRLRLEPLQEIDRWLDDYRAIWTQRFANLGAYLDRPGDSIDDDPQH